MDMLTSQLEQAGLDDESVYGDANGSTRLASSAVQSFLLVDDREELQVRSFPSVISFSIFLPFFGVVTSYIGLETHLNGEVVWLTESGGVQC